jgi:hypothetical protein
MVAVISYTFGVNFQRRRLDKILYLFGNSDMRLYGMNYFVTALI